MIFKFDSRSEFFDAIEAIREEGFRDRISFDVHTLSIYPTDEDAQEAIQYLLSDLGIGINGDDQPDDSMDGDHGSALASAGFGTDEDYEHNSCDEGGE